MTVPRLRASDSLLVVIDIQEKLLAKMPAGEMLVHNAGFLLDVANLVNVPILATEQYPKGLGRTTLAIATRLPMELPEKTAFSCCGAPGFLDELKSLGRPHIILVGMEGHVCVLQTALDLIESGFTVFLPVDAIISRHTLDQEMAFRRLERAGAILTTVETIAFEWLENATHPQFKAVSRLVIDRTAMPNPKSPS
jgi:nicotinamidase-related amidase